MDYAEPAPGVADEVLGHFAALKQYLKTHRPHRILVFGPDHFNGFFYRLMPSFCIGGSARSVGDWATPAGPFELDALAARDCAEFLLDCDIDVAWSEDMVCDHGITQILDRLFEWSQLPPVIPLFINCAAPPLPRLKRVRALGAAVGEFVKQSAEPCLIIASGGLSHDPPIPQLDTAPPVVRDRLIAGGDLNPEQREERQQRVLNDARAQTAGSSSQRPLNPAWDEAFMRQLTNFEFDQICQMSDPAITADAGCGGHEVRNWIAAAAAAEVLELGSLKPRYYRAIPEWVAGFGIASTIAV